jgi:hypothetical protein
MQAIVDEKYFKNTAIISPGLVGPVGDVLGSVRLRQSAPDMKLRYEKAFSGKNESKLGSNVQDGFSYSYTSGGGPAATVDSNWVNKKFKTNHGWIYQDLRAPDKTLQPVMGSTGRYDWLNRVANVYEAKRTGDMFLPLPGEYQPTGVPRGGQVPRIIAVDVPTIPDLQGPDVESEKPKEIATPSQMAIICTAPSGRQTYKLVNRPGRAPQAPAQAPPPPAQKPPAPSTMPDELDYRNMFNY